MVVVRDVLEALPEIERLLFHVAVLVVLIFWLARYVVAEGRTLFKGRPARLRRTRAACRTARES